MRTSLVFAALLLCLAGLGLTGCSGKFLGGTAVGVVGAGAGYEYKAKKEMDRIKEEFEAGRMSKEEYEIRKDQIERMSIIQ
ncbi:MAG: hypothetical protein D6690_10655 [Nitrospirae bacterium]|nr:MAG: hypothetical protein D6690_10655 [Nitrospirota bacterium]